ncbi:MAG: precorrin-4 C(11)-methyltransferase [Acidimicrobiaceae bacterium]|nr:precorrin-4 C(11)-methyltransferase [Acidimicrobiaceae bacterium]
MISFVGAGPGDPELITIKGRNRLAEADTVIWASSLVPQELLSHCGAKAAIIDSAGMTLEDVLEVYAISNGKQVVRLHSGDPSVYGAIQEQIDYCIENQINFEIVPGVTSVAAAAAILQREFTIPALSQSVVFTRLAGKTKSSMPERESVSAFARIGGTLGIFLSGARPEELQNELLCEGTAFNDSTPAAIIIRATWSDEKVIRTTIGSLAKEMAASGANRTVLVIVGEVLTGPTQRSHLYSPNYAHRFRKRSLPGTTSGRPAKQVP